MLQGATPLASARAPAVHTMASLTQGPMSLRQGTGALSRPRNGHVAGPARAAIGGLRRLAFEVKVKSMAVRSAAGGGGCPPSTLGAGLSCATSGASGATVGSMKSLTAGNVTRSLGRSESDCLSWRGGSRRAMKLPPATCQAGEQEPPSPATAASRRGDPQPPPRRRFQPPMASTAHYPTSPSSSDSHNHADVAAAKQPEYVYVPDDRLDRMEAWIEQRIFNCRFLTLMAVVGSLVGATLCFIKGSIFVAESVKVFFFSCIKGFHTGKIIMLLVEALDVYLIGTVMLIFGMGLYELFIDALYLPPETQGVASPLLRSQSSSLFGLFPLRARPKWLEINSLDEMKTKLGHVIVMILLVGMFEKSKKIVIHSAMDLLLFSGSVSLAAACLYLLSKLHE